MSVEDRIRRSFQRQAVKVDPSDDWEHIVRRVRTGEAGTVPAPSHTRRVVIIAAAFAIFLLASVPLWIVLHADTTAPADSPGASDVLPSSQSATIPNAAPACRGDQLSAREIATDGAAGNVWAPVELVNRSSDACTLSGYFDVRFLDAAGHDLNLQAKHSRNDTAGVSPSPIPRAQFVLAPGAKSWFIVYFSDVQPPCVRVLSLAIRPPGGSGTVTMRVNPIHEWAVCVGELTVTAATPTRPGSA